MQAVANPPENIETRHRNAAGLIWSSITAAAFIGFSIALSVYIASRRLLWFDEIMTVRLAALPDAATIWKAVTHADPAMPFPYILLVHAIFRITGATPIAARILSALAVGAGLLIVFDCARRLTDGLHGLIAMSLLACSFLPYYGYEARSYALYFMLSAALLWVWAHTDNTRGSAAAFFALFLGGMLTHYYFVFCIVPYAIARWWPIPSKVVAGVLGIICGVALLAPEILAEHGNSADFWSPPSFTAFREVYADMFPGVLFLIATIMIWIALASFKTTALSVRPMIETERIGWLFLLIPAAGYIVASRVTHAFVTRYFIGMLPGVAVAFSCLIWRSFRASRLVPAGILALLALPALAGQISTARHPRSIDPFGQQTQTRRILDLEKNIRADGKQFILCTNSMLHLEAQYYSQHPEQYGLLIPSDAGRTVPTVRLTLAMTDFYPFRVWTAEDLKKHARESAVVQPGAEILRIMRDAGFRAKVRFAEPLEITYFE